MLVDKLQVPLNERLSALKSALDSPGQRLGLITSIDGSQLATLVLKPENNSAALWITPLDGAKYPSATPLAPQCHWFERAVFDLFGLYPEGHPRLKHLLLHDSYPADFLPLAAGVQQFEPSAGKRQYEFLKVEGDGVYEIPVGPIHAGIIEPGHFRLSCLGEIILNLEVRLGYLHRGIEKKLTEIAWQKTRFVSEAAASDTAVANALANAVALESLLTLEVPPRAHVLRTLALEFERIAMHISDIGGMATDLGCLGIAANMARMRGNALQLAELLAGSRFMRGFVCPGGVARNVSDRHLQEMQQGLRRLHFAAEPVIEMFIDNPVVEERLSGVCRITSSLAKEFALVGVAARACGIAYDTRQHFTHGIYPQQAPRVAVGKEGDALSRINVRIAELYGSLSFCYNLIQDIPSGQSACALPSSLPGDSAGAGIVEAFRGELIHLIFTDTQGRICRYAIKDPSFNNWTGVSIAARNNLVADFPICNKSFSLSYSGHDL